jgi:ABC-type sugar transport system ATPase subunit
MIDIRVTRRQGDFQVDAAFQTGNAGITALFGPSGAGKTSVINMVAGLIRPDKGRIVVQERVLFDSGDGVDLPPEKRSIGYIFQDGRLFPHLTVHGNLSYGMKLIPRARRLISLEQVVDLLGIEHFLDRRPARLSGGEKQRVAIGRALLTSPRLLLMDEPLSSLDEPRKDEVLPFIAKLPRTFRIPILYVTHSTLEIQRLADHLVLMQAGMRKSELNLHLVENRFSFSRSNQVDKHVLDREMLCSELGSNERNVSFGFVTERHALEIVVAEPFLLQLCFKSRLKDGIPRNLRYVSHGQVKGCPRYGIFFQQCIVRHVKEQRVIRRERHIQPATKQLWKWTGGNLSKQKVVGERTYGQSDLVEVVEILKGDLMLEVDAVIDRRAQ